MKKAKIMLMAIAILATVGGALAFKAQKLGIHKYCYIETNVQPAPNDCVWTTNLGSFTAIGTKMYYFEPTLTATPESCMLLSTCDNTARNLIN